MKIFRDLSIDRKMRVIILSGIIAVSAIIVSYNVVYFRQGIEREFEERIVSLGDNVSDVIAGPLSVVLAYANEITPEMIETLKIPLDSVVQSKDVVYAVLLSNGKQLAQGNRFGIPNFKFPEGRDTGRMFKGFTLRQVVIENKNFFEIRLPIKKEEVLGEILFGFDASSLNKAIRNSLFFSVLLAMIAALLLSYLSGKFMSKAIIRPVEYLVSVAQKISEGNLKQKILTIESKDEIGILADTFNKMLIQLNNLVQEAEEISLGKLGSGSGPVTATTLSPDTHGDLADAFIRMKKNLKELVLKIRKHTDIVANSSSTLTEISEQSSRATSQLAQTISQISSSTSQVAQNSQAVSNFVVQVDTFTKKGKETIQQTLAKMQAIRDSIELSQKSIRELTQRSGEIREIVDIIAKIAEQTNLLSLNAAIEAARAGDAGRGFAVVADEIRKLAESSTLQAQQISKIINLVLGDTERTTQTVNRGVEDVAEGGELVKQSHQMFLEIAEAIEKIAKQIEQIAAAAEETSASTEEVAATSEEQAAAMQEIEASTAQLLNTTKTLQEAVEQFNL